MDTVTFYKATGHLRGVAVECIMWSDAAHFAKITEMQYQIPL